MEESEITRIKKEMREIMKTRLRNNPGRIESSEKICASIRELDEFRNADVILAYSPMKTEVDISNLYDERFLFPYIENGVMKYAPRPLVKGRMGFYEPLEKKETDYERALILVPALAFGKDLRRLGRGGGFYDRYISGKRDRLFSIGLSFEMNLLDVIPYEMHDEVLDMIITEKRIIRRLEQK